MDIYAERLGRSANSFDELYQELQKDPTYIDKITLSELEKLIQKTNPKMIGFSVPFLGNLYSAFRCAQYIKANYPEIVVDMRGGFPNTELRSLSDSRVFEFFDFITLNDGEAPTEQLLKYINNEVEVSELKRTFTLQNNQVSYINNQTVRDYKFSEVGTPDYTDIKLDQYISVIEVVNPMHRLWSDGRWNKLTMAHGCYWGKCTFCDISLDYIKIYEPIAAKQIVDRMEELIETTQNTGFHFVDEAALPALMREVALEILRRKLTVTWWTNIRFEKSFTYNLCRLLKASGCIAVSGDLEVASDRLLKLIDKGVTVEQVAVVNRNFTEAGIMVHAYLMYGFPTQTKQETINSLEMVRQMFELGILQSGFWHQFAMIAHSPVGLNPEKYEVINHSTELGTFANNDMILEEKSGLIHNHFSYGLKKSLFNYMHGVGFELSLNEWFDFKIPTLKEALDWSQGKTIFQLDNKGVPYATYVKFLKENPYPNVVLGLRKDDEVAYYAKYLEYVMFMKPFHSMKDVESFEKLNVSYDRMISWIGLEVKEEQKEMIAFLRKKGVMVMIAIAPSTDKLPIDIERARGYIQHLISRPDIIETDYPSQFINYK